jgi:outer membrane lipoprotein-sorting protein
VEAKRSLAPLKTATGQELVARVDALAASVQTMSATVDIDTTVGGEKKGKVVEFQEIRGYILAQKPKLLRMIGLLPIVRNRAFDMVSDGTHFQLSIPPKNRFISGKDEVTTISANPLENLRPQTIYDALLIPAIDEKNEIAVIEGGVQQVEDEKTHKMVTQANYHLLVLQRGAQDTWHLRRNIYFNRADLQIYRQTIYDDKGEVITDAHYSDPKNYDGVQFPSLIEIERPQEEYSISLKMVKLALNVTLKPEQFQMEIPPGATVTELK